MSETAGTQPTSPPATAASSTADANAVSKTAGTQPTSPPAMAASSTPEANPKDPEAIRQEIEATKDRISDSVEALAEIKADIDYAKSHPKQVVKERMIGAKDEMVARIVERKDEMLSHRKAAAAGSGGSPAGAGGGAKEALSKAKDTIAKAYETLETKLDDLLGVEVDKKNP